ncbi:hypothetical protein MKLM6_1892 [Methylomonas koyamae]|nr:hypothetical protein MKLM6_1892 [Methylomonas koyamae]
MKIYAGNISFVSLASGISVGGYRMLFFIFWFFGNRKAKTKSLKHL